MNFEKNITELLTKAGITVNGSQPYDLHVHDHRFYKRLYRDVNLGLGESYMEGWWDCERIDVFMERVWRARLDRAFLSWKNVLALIEAKVFNLQSLTRATHVNEAHYDLGNDLFKKMLDPRMVYTCAYWKNAPTLAQAQINKLELICQKLHLKPGLKVLDIGCGWGSFMKYAAENYGVECVGYTLSKNQLALGREMCQGWPITFVLDDYRHIQGQFDRVVSIGMFEAVGPKNFRTFMQVVCQALAPDGWALLHTMGSNTSFWASDPWYDKYIFPNGLVPSMAQLGKAVEGLLLIEDVHNLGPHYDQTLMAWHANFVAAWPELSQSYAPQFKRMWEFYLLQTAGTFRARIQQLWQIVLAKPGADQHEYRTFTQ